MKKEVELIIIGGGIAGVAAAVYARRIGLEFLLFEAGSIGGQLLFMENIDNYVGLATGTKGRDLAGNLTKTLEDLKIDVINEEISKVEIKENKVFLSGPDRIYSASCIIAATGAAFMRLGVKGEDRLLGKGVSYCAVCDGFFFKGKDVVVAGGGNTAVEEALCLAEITNKVTLIHRRKELRAVDYLQKKLFARKNIEVIFSSIVTEVKGRDLVEEIIIENIDDKQQRSIKISGLFIAIGIKPNTDFFRDIISLDEKGFIVTDEEMQSSSRFVWSCGDCRKRPLKQLITAASEGAVAALSVYKYLRGRYISS